MFTPSGRGVTNTFVNNVLTGIIWCLYANYLLLSLLESLFCFFSFKFKQKAFKFKQKVDFSYRSIRCTVDGRLPMNHSINPNV